jgi:hypothetical protein
MLRRTARALTLLRQHLYLDWFRDKRSAKSPVQSPVRQARRARLDVECLEMRDLLSTSVSSFTLDNSGNLYHTVGRQQQLIDTDVRTFAVSNSKVFDLHTAGTLEVLKSDGSNKFTSATGIASFQAVPSGPVYALTTGGSLEMIAPGSNVPRVIATNVSQFAVADNGQMVYILEYNGQLYARSNGARHAGGNNGWVYQYGDVEQLAVADNGHTVYGLEYNGQLYARSNGARYVGSNNGWVYQYGDVEQITVADNGQTIYGLEYDGQLYARSNGALYAGSNNGWNYVGYVSSFQVAPDGSAYVLVGYGGLWHYTITSGLGQIGYNVTSFQVAPDNSVYALASDGGLWRYTITSGFGQIGYNITSFQVAPDDAVYALSGDAGLWRYTITSGFGRIGYNVTSFQVAPDDAVYALSGDAGLWRYTITSGFARIGYNATSFQVAPDDAVYALTSDAGLWRYTLASGFGRIGYNITSFQVAADDLVYALTRDGGLWHYTITSGFGQIGYNVMGVGLSSNGHSLIALGRNGFLREYTGTGWTPWQGARLTMTLPSPMNGSARQSLSTGCNEGVCYNSSGQLESMSNHDGSDKVYFSYDANGNIDTIEHDLPDGTKVYTYEYYSGDTPTGSTVITVNPDGSGDKTDYDGNGSQTGPTQEYGPGGASLPGSEAPGSGEPGGDGSGETGGGGEEDPDAITIEMRRGAPHVSLAV